MPYTPLHVHTEHSSLDGLARLKDTAQECRKLGVKPIPGVDVYLPIRSRHAPKTTNVYADKGMGDADDEFTTEGQAAHDEEVLLPPDRAGAEPHRLA